MNVIEVENAWLKFNIRFRNQDMTMRRFILQVYHGARRRWLSPVPGSPLAADAPDTAGGAAPAHGPHFWALRDISLKVSSGEVVGLIGHNGAGKTTLLMMLAGIYAPDRGTVRTQGKIGTLLSLGAGFNNELTGRENIVLSGIFMGLTPRELQEKMEPIIEFAELGEFIDAPLKTYSSGMRARLGFAIATSINPDIILIDEVLEAGDAAFRKKSGNLIQTFKEQGKTIIFSTHNLPSIQQLCDRAILLDHGRIVEHGPAAAVLEAYKNGK